MMQHPPKSNDPIADEIRKKRCKTTIGVKQLPHDVAKGKGQYRPNATHLTEKSEKKLHDALVTNMDDTAMAVALVKGYDISIDRLLTLTWGDLIINGDTVRIPDFKENLTGGTRNFVRPPCEKLQNCCWRGMKCFANCTGRENSKKCILLICPAV